MYILNHTNTTLSVGQFADIAPGKYIQADKYILESAETAYAVRAKWASLHDSPPKEIAFEGETINFEVAAIEGSTVFPTDEPKAVLQEEPAAVPQEEPAAVAQPVEVEATPADSDAEATTAKKASRKTAVDTEAK